MAVSMPRMCIVHALIYDLYNCSGLERKLNHLRLSIRLVLGVSVQVMRKLGRLYSEMIFVQGYIHCDPHPGNLLIRPSTTGTEIVLLDHGLYQVCPNSLVSSI